jgi:hypothetical protein
MSDMLQLVVKVGNSQCATDYHCLSDANLNDKLKHVEHLFCVFPTIHKSHERTRNFLLVLLFRVFSWIVPLVVAKSCPVYSVPLW